MTNAQIIFTAEQELAKNGKISYTGRTFEAQDANGNIIEVQETEPIHTFQAWKELGYSVKKGSKAVTKLTIWKHTTKTDEETGQQTSKIFMKTAAFFSASQVEAAKARA